MPDLRRCASAPAPSIERLRELTSAMAELARSLGVTPEELLQCAEVAAMRLMEDRG